MLTKQEVFDTITQHLITQDARSLSPLDASCVYRGPNGLKCAVGALITDEEYSKAMEGKDVHCLIREDLMPDRLKPFAGLLASLQIIHDFAAVSEWRQRLRDLAERQDLSDAVLGDL